MYPPFSLVKRISIASHWPVRIPYQAKLTKFSTCVMKPRPKTKKIKRLQLAKKILHRFYKVKIELFNLRFWVYLFFFFLYIHFVKIVRVKNMIWFLKSLTLIVRSSTMVEFFFVDIVITFLSYDPKTKTNSEIFS